MKILNIETVIILYYLHCLLITIGLHIGVVAWLIIYRIMVITSMVSYRGLTPTRF
ncbi:hypothetical protein [Rickettsia endosymbiont of Aspidapion aeneum]|uniref:hypothetical protein n=1 Tax=Rickettsia endosymbiont of Aspidapion aeneum TaxID=3066247 RepID=UPI00313C935A